MRILAVNKCSTGGSNCGRVGQTDIDGDSSIDTLGLIMSGASLPGGDPTDSGDYLGTSLAGIVSLRFLEQVGRESVAASFHLSISPPPLPSP